MGGPHFKGGREGLQRYFCIPDQTQAFTEVSQLYILFQSSPDAFAQAAEFWESVLAGYEWFCYSPAVSRTVHKDTPWYLAPGVGLLWCTKWRQTCICTLHRPYHVKVAP